MIAIALLMLQGTPPPIDAAPDEILVQGTSPEEFRLRPLPDRYRREPLRAVTTIGSAALSGEVEAANVGGFQSNRAMMRLRFRF